MHFMKYFFRCELIEKQTNKIKFTSEVVFSGIKVVCFRNISDVIIWV